MSQVTINLYFYKMFFFLTAALPHEILMYIFRWVVSSDLDIGALEQLSLVCRGFYICARSDPPSEQIRYVIACLLTACVFISMCMVQGSLNRFYILYLFLSRDPEIWHLACLRVWGRNCTKLVPFNSWREMFLQRPRVRCDGN